MNRPGEQQKETSCFETTKALLQKLLDAGIKPERDEEVSDEIRAVHEEMAARYGKVFERLAK